MKLPIDQAENALFLVKEDFESCGFIFKDELYVDSVGGRNTCQHSYYTDYIFHTHPTHALSYPSALDIIKILKLRDNPKVSVIFTKWGVWEFTCMNKRNFDDNFIEKIKRTITLIYDKLYPFAREEMNNNLLEKILECNYNVMNYLNKTYDFDFEIYFIEWDDFFDNGFKVI